jgi:hypothetical protein
VKDSQLKEKQIHINVFEYQLKFLRTLPHVRNENRKKMDEALEID